MLCCTGGNIGVEPNLVAGKINSVSPILFHQYSIYGLKFLHNYTHHSSFLILHYWTGAPSQVCKIEQTYQLIMPMKILPVCEGGWIETVINFTMCRMVCKPKDTHCDTLLQ